MYKTKRTKGKKTMYIYGTIDIISDETHIQFIDHEGLSYLSNDIFFRLAQLCDIDELPFRLDSNDNSILWFSPVDNCTFDFDGVYLVDDDGEPHYLKDEHYLSPDHYEKLIHKALSEFVKPLT